MLIWLPVSRLYCARRGDVTWSKPTAPLGLIATALPALSRVRILARKGV